MTDDELRAARLALNTPDGFAVSKSIIIELLDELLERRARSEAPSDAKVVFTVLFHQDLFPEDAVDIDVALKALALIANRHGGGIIARGQKTDGSQVDVPVLVPVGKAPEGVN